MNDSDDALRKRVRRAWQYGAGQQEPSFDSSWRGAANRYAAGRQRYLRFASVAAIAALVVIVLNLQTRTQTNESYIDVAELLESTYWSAPSDVLLPDSLFDIYQDMPAIFESTEPAGGTLL